MDGGTVSRHPDDWLDLARVAFEIVEAAGIATHDFAIGGGTMLMTRLHHRLSQDLDIFLTDAQYLTYLSPRLNSAASQYEDYEETSHHLRIALADREIDFILAPHLTGRPTRPDTILGRHVTVETSAEILTKKLFYRGRMLKPRDVFDIAATIRIQPEELPSPAELRDLLIDRQRAAICRRLVELSADWPSRAAAISPLPAGLPILPHAVEIMREWMAGI